MLENDPDAAFIAGADAPVAETPVADAAAPAEENKGADEPQAEAVAGEPTAEAESTEAETEATSEGEETEKPRTPWFQKRIDTITREKHDLARANAALQQQIEAILASVQGQQPQGEGNAPGDAPQPPRTAPAPQQNLTAEQIRAEAERIVAAQSFTRACNEIYERGAKDFKDWTDAVTTLNTALPSGITPDLVDAVTEAGDPHKTLHYLGKHPEIAQEVAALPPARMAVRLAKIATDLNKPAAPKPVSQAPAPVKPIGGGSTSVETDPEKMSTEQWMKWHDEQQEKRRRRA